MASSVKERTLVMWWAYTVLFVWCNAMVCPSSSTFLYSFTGILSLALTNGGNHFLVYQITYNDFMRSLFSLLSVCLSSKSCSCVIKHLTPNDFNAWNPSFFVDLILTFTIITGWLICARFTFRPWWSHFFDVIAVLTSFLLYIGSPLKTPHILFPSVHAYQEPRVWDCFIQELLE